MLTVRVVWAYRLKRRAMRRCSDREQGAACEQLISLFIKDSVRGREEAQRVAINEAALVVDARVDRMHLEA
jgi:hypothetical protein